MYDRRESPRLFGGANKTYASKKHPIGNDDPFHQPYEATKVGSHKVAISFWYFTKNGKRQYRETILLLPIDKDEVIQDLDKRLQRSA